MIELEARQAVYRRAIETFGEDAQLWMVIEEMSELAKEICKYVRGKRCPDDLADEIADVEIMLEQARMIFGVDDLVREHKDAKIERLRERVRQNMSNRGRWRNADAFVAVLRDRRAGSGCGGSWFRDRGAV